MNTEPPRLTWNETRAMWNSLGKCAREACKGPLPEDHDYLHAHTGLRYCERCAELINRMNPEGDGAGGPLVVQTEKISEADKQILSQIKAKLLPAEGMARCPSCKWEGDQGIVSATDLACPKCFEPGCIMGPEKPVRIKRREPPPGPERAAHRAAKRKERNARKRQERASRR